jgi:hypothetical protein
MEGHKTKEIEKKIEKKKHQEKTYTIRLASFGIELPDENKT